MKYGEDIAGGIVMMATHRGWRMSAAAGILMSCASAAWSAPVYIGLQETGVNSGAITEEAIGAGTASITNLVYGNTTNGTFQLTVNVTGTGGTPSLPEPDLSSTLSATTESHPGIIAIYVTEINQFPVGFSDFYSQFGVSSLGAGITLTESTYLHECVVPNASCNTTIGAGGDLFATTTLLSTTNFSATGLTTLYSGNGLPIATTPYAITEVYTIDFTRQSTSTSASINVTVPEPMSITLLGGSMIGLRLLRGRRRADRARRDGTDVLVVATP
jgi:hypothetical protein